MASHFVEAHRHGAQGLGAHVSEEGEGERAHYSPPPPRSSGATPSASRYARASTIRFCFGISRIRPPWPLNSFVRSLSVFSSCWWSRAEIPAIALSRACAAGVEGIAAGRGAAFLRAG